jgi:hypothetical protein
MCVANFCATGGLRKNSVLRHFCRKIEPGTQDLSLVALLGVGNFVTAKAPDFNKFQQTSTSLVTWFGTRRPEVQILSPRPFFSNEILGTHGSYSMRPADRQNLRKSHLDRHRSDIRCFQGNVIVTNLVLVLNRNPLDLVL